MGNGVDRSAYFPCRTELQELVLSIGHTSYCFFFIFIVCIFTARGIINMTVRNPQMTDPIKYFPPNDLLGINAKTKQTMLISVKTTAPQRSAFIDGVNSL
jgi:hypothetical protein